MNEDLAQRFFDAIVKIARREGLLSSEHLTVDGTLIKAWAGQKSFKPKDGPPPPPDGQGGVDFRGTKRTNDTCASTSDPEAKSARKGPGKEAKLCFGGHALMENRNGLCVDIRVSSALESETAAAAELLKRRARKRLRPRSLGADKGYHSEAFVDFLRRRDVRPHIAQIEGRNTPGLDARTTRHASYWVSQKRRKQRRKPHAHPRDRARRRHQYLFPLLDAHRNQSFCIKLLVMHVAAIFLTSREIDGWRFVHFLSPQPCLRFSRFSSNRTSRKNVNWRAPGWHLAPQR